MVRTRSTLQISGKPNKSPRKISGKPNKSPQKILGKSIFCAYFVVKLEYNTMSDRVFKRKIYDKILKWKVENDGKSALLIEGARRVGKSTIVEEFARKEYETYILIDFNTASKEIKSLFEDLMDLNYLFLRLQQAYKTQLIERKSVIVFDEVQQCPAARQAIKYLVKDGRYDYIETGSLISIKKNTEYITIPSEEDRIKMNPMDYEEFCWALGDEVSIPLLRQFWDGKTALRSGHRLAMRNIRLYMLVGGMPQAVNAYIDTNNFERVDAVKRKILNLYEEDFLKIDPSGRISRMFISIPSVLSRNTSRYTPSSYIPATDPMKTVELVKSLEDSKTVNIAYHADDPNVGMALNANTDKYKIFVADTGLFVTLAFWDKDFSENIIYDKLLSDKLSVNLGYVYENFVAQMLVAEGNRLFYHTWRKDDKHYYEIDFLITKGHKIVPIEVKSSGYNTHKSLDEFSKRYSSRIGAKYLIYTKDLSHDDDVILAPVYMSSFL